MIIFELSSQRMAITKLEQIYCLMMAERPENNGTKKEEDATELKSCEKCMKFFTTEQAYQTHLKMKHQDQDDKQASQEEEEEGSEEDDEQDKGQSKNNSKKQASKGVPIRSRMLEMQRNELQDNTYTFLGQLGEKNIQPAASRAEIINFANDQKLTGQTNYSINKVIRTPYEEPIKCSDQVPLSEIESSKYKQFLLKLKNQLIIIQAKLQAERQTWELRDPMAPEEQVMDEFSLMDIKKLIQNYPKRQIHVQHPHFSIFLLWIGRICKPPAFRQFYLILGEYIAEYYSTQANRSKGETMYDNWKGYFAVYEAKKISSQLLEKLKIFDEKSCKKLIDYFVQWADLFRALSI